MKRLSEWVWLSAQGFRSKIAVSRSAAAWNFDGSSTGHATSGSATVHSLQFQRTAPVTDVIMRRALSVKHPFLADSELVLASTDHDYRDLCQKLTDRAAPALPKFGFEQEYSLWQDGSLLGWKEAEQGPFYCGNGGDKIHPLSRNIAEQHLQACLEAGLAIGGINAEVMPGQWEFQIGPAIGVQAADQLWLARFLLERVAERHHCHVDWRPKIHTHMNGAGLHTNFCWATFYMPGFEQEPVLKALAADHSEFLKICGEGNDQRLTGQHETSSSAELTWGQATRCTSIRLPTSASYFEDRRPAANADPYQLVAKHIQTLLPVVQADLIARAQARLAKETSLVTRQLSKELDQTKYALPRDLFLALLMKVITTESIKQLYTTPEFAAWQRAIN